MTLAKGSNSTGRNESAVLKPGDKVAVRWLTERGTLHHWTVNEWTSREVVYLSYGRLDGSQPFHLKSGCGNGAGSGWIIEPADLKRLVESNPFRRFAARRGITKGK